MKFLRKNLLLLFLAVSLAAGGGCSTFREYFSSDPGAEKSRSERKRKAARRDAEDDGELKSRRYKRDPLDSLVFNDRNRSPHWAENNLNDDERAALRRSMDPDSSRVIDRVYLDNERQRKKRAEWVFGPNPFRK